jgi:hypothetical protein
MPIAMHEVSRTNPEPAYFNGSAEIDDMGIGMRDGYSAREKVEPGRFDLIQIADRSIGNAANALDRQTYASMDLPHERTQSRDTIDVAQN